MPLKLIPMTLVLNNAYEQTAVDGEDNLVDMIRTATECNPALRSFIAGSVSGTCSTVLFQPLDLIKTRIQRRGAASLSIAGAAKDAVNESVFGLWRGVAPSVLRAVPGIGIHFGTLSLLKDVSGKSESTAGESLIMGALARCVATTAMIPLTVVKTRCESGVFAYDRVTTALVGLYYKEGVRGLGRGLLPTIARDAPFSGVYLMFYTQLKKKVGSTGLEESISPACWRFLCGLTAGVLASAATQPADVVKTRMQLTRTDARGVLKTARSIWIEKGLGGFFAGTAPRMLRRSLMAAMTWTVYEEMMKKMGLN